MKVSEKWDEYFQAARKLGPNPFYSRIEPYLGQPGKVAELGFGAGTGIQWWLDRGWQVVAVDAEDCMCEHLRSLHSPDTQLEIVCSDYVDANWGEVDVVAAVFSLFFVPPGRFECLWPKVVASIKPGGLFCGQLIGQGDEWATEEHVSHTQAEVDGLLRDFDILEIEEVRRAGKTLYGAPKEWHVYHVIARKRA
ncbi:class I SAM-dependent methyltransferase [Kamptonema cortianum]|nr:class I SAM-dependent methyltransferase [Geitlerinema splendidum]MDK3161154.1 class I SAM-dependent methyltransferase [Kamptonema cortianum]